MTSKINLEIAIIQLFTHYCKQDNKHMVIFKLSSLLRRSAIHDHACIISGTVSRPGIELFPHVSESVLKCGTITEPTCQ